MTANMDCPTCANRGLRLRAEQLCGTFMAQLVFCECEAGARKSRETMGGAGSHFYEPDHAED